MTFRRNINPAGAIEDFKQVYKAAGKNRWRFMALAAAITFTLFGTMAKERVMIPPERPEIEIISTLEAGRTDAEIIASNIAHQERMDRIAAEQAARDEEVKEIYRSLGRMSGIDVEAVEAEAEAERAEAETQRTEASRLLAERQAEIYGTIEE